MSGRILILEDEVILALDLADQLESAGFQVIGPATSVAAALRLIAAEPCDAAVLDINLGVETSAPVAAELKKAGIPFIAVSGNSREHQPEIFHGAPWVPKPCLAKDLIAVVSSCLRP
jgi:DNA-binding response OmpR family regulator